MNRRKLIYFLSAFVVIIGCYALNLSYSLFTQNISSESNVVDSTIPILNASLEEDTFTIPANSGEVVRLKINNTGNINIQFGVSIPELTEGINAYLVEKNNNDIVGTLESDNNKEVLVYIENTTLNDITVIFNLDSKYETISFDTQTFINSSNIDCVNKVKLLNESILARATSTEITDETRTILDEEFDSGNITGISGENERKLITAEDDYGTSYVYRGAVKDNYVNFAGFTWRIVRINGDGSIRLILDGTLDKVCADYEKDTDGNCTKYSGTTSQYNESYDDNAYIGYMYGFTGGVENKCLTKDSTNEYTIDSSEIYTTKETCEGSGGRWASTPYETTHINKNSSTIKTNIDNFYKAYLLSNYNNHIADVIFCNDKSLAKKEYSSNNTALGFGTQITYYAGIERLKWSSSTNLTKAEPNLKCAENESNNYSRFTVNKNNINSVETNGDLTYPIALLNTDEFVLAGGWRNSEIKIYLQDAQNEGLMNDYWWPLTPHNVDSRYAYMFSFSANNSMLYSNAVRSFSGIRPVINLKVNTVIESGDGTKETTYDESGNVLTGPYVIK